MGPDRLSLNLVPCCPFPCSNCLVDRGAFSVFAPASAPLPRIDRDSQLPAGRSNSRAYLFLPAGYIARRSSMRCMRMFRRDVQAHTRLLYLRCGCLTLDSEHCALQEQKSHRYHDGHAYSTAQPHRAVRRPQAGSAVCRELLSSGESHADSRHSTMPIWPPHPWCTKCRGTRLSVPNLLCQEVRPPYQ